MRPSSRSLALGFLILAVLALPSSVLAAQGPIRPQQPTVSSLSWSEMVSLVRSWLLDGWSKPGAWRSAVPGYDRVWSKAGSSMDPNGAASTTPVVPPTLPTPPTTP